jgi:hypothetical protein
MTVTVTVDWSHMYSSEADTVAADKAASFRDFQRESKEKSLAQVKSHHTAIPTIINVRYIPT